MRRGAPAGVLQATVFFGAYTSGWGADTRPDYRRPSGSSDSRRPRRGTGIGATVGTGSDPDATRTIEAGGRAQVPENFRFCHVCGDDLHAEASGAPLGDAPAERVSAPAVSGAPQPAAACARLALIQPDGSEGESFPLPAEGSLIGRATGGIFANDAYLSPEHAEFRFEGDQLVVKDMESLNGVYIRIEPEVPIELFDGSIFRVGQEILRFEAPVAPDPADDGTQHMGSPHRGYLGRISLMIGRETTGNSFPIPPQGIHLGRERGDVVFPEDGYVSGLHCRVNSEVGHVFLTDVGSSNGTFVRVSNESYVPQGTFVLMGQQLFRAEY
ncbi:MAG: FHA domain-containing protein [Deltaproteobacteria bacterium]|nr:FHA domain-containing protein [Deltaproteobacteria bacterium]